MAVDYFLKIEGVEGEAASQQHKGEIEIDSFSWGESRTGGASGGGGGGKVQMQDFHFVMKTNKSSPKLFLACATGEHFKKALLSLRKAGETQGLEFLKLTFTDLLVSSFQLAGDGEVPLEQISLSFAKIEWEYTPPSASGGAGAKVTAGFNVKTGQPA
jgi:type VI secretion system secreted protein Hcp